MTVQGRVQVTSPPGYYSHVGSACSLGWRSTDGSNASPTPILEDRIPVTIITGSSTAEKEELVHQIIAEYSQSYFISVIEQGLPRGSLKRDLEFMYDKLTRPSMDTSYKNSPPILKVPSVYNCVELKKKHALIISLHSLADPLPVLETFYHEDSFQRKFRLSSVLAVVNCDRVAEAVRSDDNATIYTTPMQHLQTSIADRIFLYNERQVPVEQDSVEHKLAGIYPIPILRFPFEDKSKNLLELSLCDLDPLEAEISSRRQSETRNSQRVDFPLTGTSTIQLSWNLSFQFSGDLSMDLCTRWMEQLFLSHGVVRYQAVFSIMGMSEKYIVHGLRGTFWSGGFSPTSLWNHHEERVNQVYAVVISNDSSSTSRDRVRELEKTLKACLVTNLRFGVGDVVQVLLDNEWQGGRIVGLWDKGNAYSVHLQLNGKKLLIPTDDDSLIRKPSKHLGVKKHEN